jgi:hypothetical protein
LQCFAHASDDENVLWTTVIVPSLSGHMAQSDLGGIQGMRSVAGITGALKYRCKAAGKDVETSIQTDDMTLVQMNRMKLSVWCPHCKDSHSIKASEAYVDYMRAWKAA